MVVTVFLPSCVKIALLCVFGAVFGLIFARSCSKSFVFESWVGFCACFGAFRLVLWLFWCF